MYIVILSEVHSINDFTLQWLSTKIYYPSFQTIFLQHNAISIIEQTNNDLYMHLHLELSHQLTGREK